MGTPVSSRLQWYFNRLRAMSLREVGWRVSQQFMQRRERRRFAAKRGVASGMFYNDSGFKNGGDAADGFNAGFLGIRFGVVPEGFRRGAVPRLLGGFRYGGFAGRWHAAFQTAGEWPQLPSYSLGYKQSLMGDARCNWELNRHFQWPLLAAEYCVTRNGDVLEQLQDEFDDWNRSNPFLWGISWTSVMEVAIRSVSWMLTLAFLKESGVAGRLCEELATGILNMTGYVVRHRSRYSSANNHLLVEMTAVGLAGLAFGREEWVGIATATLDRELDRQNSPDGVNLEMSLHYHAFVMEAYLLLMRGLRVSGREVPQRWRDMLGRMAEFVCHSMVSATAAMEFGDADEGKIIDLAGEGSAVYYDYVLQLASLETGRRFSAFDVPQLTVEWLYSPEEIEASLNSPAYDASRSRTFEKGGYTFLRSVDGRVVVGIDHAPLGFGSIAAHGHADAMSFQVYDNGEPVLVDSGTYLYHMKNPERDAMRGELAHNTVCHAGHPQSQMLGAFLWGKQAETAIKYGVVPDEDVQTVEIEGKTFDGCRMHRRMAFDATCGSIEITDMVHSPEDIVSFITPLPVTVHGDEAVLGGLWRIECCSGQKMGVEQVEISPCYGMKRKVTAIRLHPCNAGECRVRIRMKMADNLLE